MKDDTQPICKARGRMSDLFVAEGDPVRNQDPPFQVRNLRKFYVVTTIDPDRVQPHLPRGLKVASTNTGVMSINVIGDGTWGPHTSALHGVAVEGMESPDGMEAVCFLGGYADCGARELWDQYYLHAIREGTGTVSFEGGQVRGDSAQPDGTGRLSMTATAVDPGEAPIPQRVTQDSSFHYLGDAPDGSARIFSMYAYAKTVIPLRIDSIELGPDLPPALLALEPLSVQFGILIENMDLLLSAPRTVERPRRILKADHLRGGLLSVIDRHPSAVVVLDGANRLRYVNRMAGQQHGDWLTQGMSFAPQVASDRAAMATALTAVRSGAPVSAPVVLRATSGAPVVARALAASPGLAGSGGVVLVFSDLDSFNGNGNGNGDPVQLLRLMGLTQAEARLAAALGTGQSTRDAASHLGIAEATARSSLKTVYSKLGVARQSELARIVARLELA